MNSTHNNCCLHISTGISEGRRTCEINHRGQTRNSRRSFREQRDACSKRKNSDTGFCEGKGMPFLHSRYQMTLSRNFIEQIHTKSGPLKSLLALESEVTPTNRSAWVYSKPGCPTECLGSGLLGCGIIPQALLPLPLILLVLWADLSASQGLGSPRKLCSSAYSVY